MNLTFEIITIGELTKIKIKNQQNLLHLLASNGDLWQKPIISKNSINEENKSLNCSINTLSTEIEDAENSYIRFFLSASGQYDELEPFRLRLLDFLKSQSFLHTYVIKDGISKKIACEIYPLINDLENSLRGYLIRFFIEKLGINWWDKTADAEMKQKVSQRKNNEKDFSNYIDNKAYLIDFGELGKIIYSLSSGYVSKDDILKKIDALEESPEALKTLKQELQSNYSKFFKSNFKENKFQQKWESIEKIRHKVAHNNLFTKNDLTEAKSNYKQIIKIINDAKIEIEKINLTEQEIQDIKEHTVYESNAMYGEFMSSWIQLELLLDHILASRNIKDNSMIRLPREKTHILEKNQIIDKKLLNKIDFTRNFRNQLVHGVNIEFNKKNISNILNQLKEVNKELELIKNKKFD